MRILKQMALTNLLLVLLNASSNAELAESIPILNNNLSIAELDHAVKTVMDNYRDGKTTHVQIELQPMDNPYKRIQMETHVIVHPNMLQDKKPGSNSLNSLKSITVNLTQRTNQIGLEAEVGLEHKPLRAHMVPGGSSAHRIKDGRITNLHPTNVLASNWAELRLSSAQIVKIITLSVQAGIKAIGARALK